MATWSRRKAREAALRALYEIDLAQSAPMDALDDVCAEMNLTAEHQPFALRILLGVVEKKSEIDNRLSKLIREFDYDRVAAVDRNVLRMAAFELLFEPAIPPAVSINEAVAIVKRYSTSESGRFVNGVLAKLVRETPKANWDPAAAPPEEDFAEESPDEAREPEVELVQADSEEAVAAKKFGSWTVRTDDGKHS